MKLSRDQVEEMIRRIEHEIARQKMLKKDFYEKSGVSSSLYSQWNTGSVNPTMKSVGQIAAALGVSVEYLTGQEEIKNQPASEEDELIEELQMLRDREDLRALLHVGYKNTPAQVRKLAELMQSMNGEGN